MRCWMPSTTRTFTLAAATPRVIHSDSVMVWPRTRGYGCAGCRPTRSMVRRSQSMWCSSTSMCASDLTRQKALLLCLGLVSVVPSVFAQQPSREREAVRRFQQQIAKLQQEIEQLQKDKTEIDGKLKQATAERDRLKAQSGK